MTELISEELNYSPVVNNHSTVIYRTVAPQGASSVTLAATSSVGPTEFLLPPSVWNPSKSRLNFSLAIAAGGTYYNYINANTLTSIARVVLYDSATNAVWADVSNLDKYAMMISAPATKLDEFLTKSYNTSAGGVVATAAPYPIEDISRSNVATVNDTGANVDVGLQNAYLGRRQFYIGGSNAIASLNVSIPFSAFKFTALATSKNIYCPSNLVLQIYWNAIDQFAFKASALDNPTTDAAACGATTLSGISVQLANEGNLSIVSQTISKVMSSGLSLPVAYPTVTRQAPGATTAPSYQLQLTSGYGSRILFLATSFFTNAGSNNTAQVHSNNTNVMTRVNTFINSVALKYPNGFDCTTGQDWIYNNKELFKKSAVQTNGEFVQSEWAFVDSFFGESPLCELDQHKVDGLDVKQQSSTWSIQATTTGTAYIFITAIIGQKMLVISNQGSQIM